MRRVSARVDLRSTEEGMGSRLRLHEGRLFAGKTGERAGIRVGGRDSATPLRCAPNDMWGGMAEGKWVPASAGTTEVGAGMEWGGERERVWNQLLGEDGGGRFANKAPTRWMSDG